MGVTVDFVFAAPCLEDGALRGLLEGFNAMLCLAPSVPEMLIYKRERR